MASALLPLGVHERLDKVIAMLDEVSNRLSRIERQLNIKKTKEENLASAEDVPKEFEQGFRRLVEEAKARVLTVGELDWPRVREILQRRGVETSESVTCVGASPDRLVAEFNGKARTFVMSSDSKMFFVSPSVFLIEDFESDEAWAANMCANYFSLG